MYKVYGSIEILKHTNEFQVLSEHSVAHRH